MSGTETKEIIVLLTKVGKRVSHLLLNLVLVFTKVIRFCTEQ